MIPLTSLNGNKKYLRPSHILEIRKTPDTVLVLCNGNCMIVKETVEEVLDMIFVTPSCMAAEVLH
ncbi:MAG: hypothetical protein A2020_02970 [Lentisphaerae bacterium GWF2_45_14]|nr:MAG: hypothetical protein A2020_02970 [Lentisphaerae bacterium GWF2_45_14]